MKGILNIKNVAEVKKLVAGSGLLGKNFNCVYNPLMNCVELSSSRKPFLYEARIVGDTLRIYMPMANPEGPSIEEEPYPYITEIPMGTIKIEETQ